MRFTTIIITFFLTISNVYSQSSTIGVLFGSGDLFLSTDDINTSVINT